MQASRSRVAGAAHPEPHRLFAPDTGLICKACGARLRAPRWVSASDEISMLRDALAGSPDVRQEAPRRECPCDRLRDAVCSVADGNIGVADRRQLQVLTRWTAETARARRVQRQAGNDVAVLARGERSTCADWPRDLRLVLRAGVSAAIIDADVDGSSVGAGYVVDELVGPQPRLLKGDRQVGPTQFGASTDEVRALRKGCRDA
jgi:hypothetical protein